MVIFYEILMITKKKIPAGGKQRKIMGRQNPASGTS
jgi:hypothetical protein